MEEAKMIALFSELANMAERLIELERKNNIEGLLRVCVDADGYIDIVVNGYDLIRTDSASEFYCRTQKGYQE